MNPSILRSALTDTACVEAFPPFISKVHLPELPTSDGEKIPKILSFG